MNWFTAIDASLDTFSFGWRMRATQGLFLDTRAFTDFVDEDFDSASQAAGEWR
jgi:hypothetical protein